MERQKELGGRHPAGTCVLWQPHELAYEGLGESRRREQVDTREVRSLDLESQAPRAACPSGLISLSAEETHCRRPSPSAGGHGSQEESNPFRLVRGPSREGAPGGESVSLKHRNPLGVPASFSRPQFLLLSHSAPHPWLGVGLALQHCSESCFINRKILNTDLGIKQGGWLWAVVF